MSIWSLLLILELVSVVWKVNKLLELVTMLLVNLDFWRTYSLCMVEKPIEEIVIWFVITSIKMLYLYSHYFGLESYPCTQVPPCMIVSSINSIIWLSLQYLLYGLQCLTMNLKNQNFLLIINIIDLDLEMRNSIGMLSGDGLLMESYNLVFYCIYAFTLWIGLLMMMDY